MKLIIKIQWVTVNESTKWDLLEIQREGLLVRSTVSCNSTWVLRLQGEYEEGNRVKSIKKLEQ